MPCDSRHLAVRLGRLAALSHASRRGLARLGMLSGATATCTAWHCDSVRLAAPIRPAASPGWLALLAWLEPALLGLGVQWPVPLFPVLKKVRDGRFGCLKPVLGRPASETWSLNFPGLFRSRPVMVPPFRGRERLGIAVLVV